MKRGRARPPRHASEPPGYRTNCMICSDYDGTPQRVRRGSSSDTRCVPLIPPTYKSPCNAQSLGWHHLDCTRSNNTSNDSHGETTTLSSNGDIPLRELQWLLITRRQCPHNAYILLLLLPFFSFSNDLFKRIAAFSLPSNTFGTNSGFYSCHLLYRSFL